MNFSGILIGVLTFFLIGLFHPIVIYAEYYFGSRCWPVFLLVGRLLEAKGLREYAEAARLLKARLDQELVGNVSIKVLPT